MSKENPATKTGDNNIEAQAREQTGQKQVRIRIDETGMRSEYANAFRTSETAEEVILDFGMNTVRPASQQEQAEIIFKASERIIMNYYSAKRLTIAMGQLIRRYEQQFGELELDVAKRRISEKK